MQNEKEEILKKRDWISPFRRLLNAGMNLLKQRDMHEQSSEKEMGLTGMWKSISSLPIEWSVDDTEVDDGDRFNQIQRITIDENLRVKFRNWDKESPKICEVSGSSLEGVAGEFSFSNTTSEQVMLSGTFLSNYLQEKKVDSVYLTDKDAMVFMDSELTPNVHFYYINEGGTNKQIVMNSYNDRNGRKRVVFNFSEGAWRRDDKNSVDFDVTNPITNEDGITTFKVDSQDVVLPPINQGELLKIADILSHKIVDGYKNLTKINPEGGFGGRNASDLNHAGRYANLSSRQNAAENMEIGPLVDIQDELGKSLPDPRWSSDKIGSTED